MTSEQKLLVDLLKEITDFCEIANAKYSLVGNQLLFLKSKRRIAGCELDIAMSWEGFQCFRKTFELAKLKNRQIEDLMNNPTMPGWYFRYVDTSTTLFSLDYALTRKAHGVGINIHILRKSTLFHPLLSFVEKGLRYAVERNRDFDQMPSCKGTVHKAVVLLLRKIMGNESFCQYFFKRFQKTALLHTEKRSFLLMPRNIKVQVPKRFLTDVNDTSFYHGVVTVSKHSDKYLKEQYGIRYKSFMPYYRKENYMNICSLDIPYKEFLPLIKETLEDGYFWKKRRKFLWDYKKNIRAKKESQEKRWQYFYMAKDRFADWKYYIPKKNDIMLMYKKGKYDELWLILSRYRSHLEKYAKVNVAYSIDEDIWEICMHLYQLNGYGVYVEKLRKLITLNRLPDIVDKNQRR